MRRSSSNNITTMNKSFGSYTFLIIVKLAALCSAIYFGNMLFARSVGVNMWQIDWTQQPVQTGHNVMQVFTTNGPINVLGLPYMHGLLLTILTLLIAAWICSLALEWFNNWCYWRRKNQLIANGQWISSAQD